MSTIKPVYPQAPIHPFSPRVSVVHKVLWCAYSCARVRTGQSTGAGGSEFPTGQQGQRGPRDENIKQSEPLGNPWRSAHPPASPAFSASHAPLSQPNPLPRGERESPLEGIVSIRIRGEISCCGHQQLHVARKSARLNRTPSAGCWVQATQASVCEDAADANEVRACPQGGEKRKNACATGNHRNGLTPGNEELWVLASSVVWRDCSTGVIPTCCCAITRPTTETIGGSVHLRAFPSSSATNGQQDA